MLVLDPQPLSHGLLNQSRSTCCCFPGPNSASTTRLQGPVGFSPGGVPNFTMGSLLDVPCICSDRCRERSMAPFSSLSSWVSFRRFIVVLGDSRPGLDGSLLIARYLGAGATRRCSLCNLRLDFLGRSLQCALGGNRGPPFAADRCHKADEEHRDCSDHYIG